jgi:hypothetical protein
MVFVVGVVLESAESISSLTLDEIIAVLNWPKYAASGVNEGRKEECDVDK